VLVCKGRLQGCLCGGAQGACSGDRNEASALKGGVVDTDVPLLELLVIGHHLYLLRLPRMLEYYRL